MPLSDEQTAAVATLASADPKEVAEALRVDANPVYQHAFRHGRNQATEEKATEISAKDAEITTLTEARDAEKARADALGSKDADFNAERERLESIAAEAKANAEAAQTAAANRVAGVYQSREGARLQAKFVALGVDADYAAQVLVPKALSQIRVGDTPEGATEPTISYLDADGVPLSGGLDALAAAGRAGVADKWISSAADSGSGTSSGGSGSPALSAEIQRVHADVDSRYGSGDTAQTAARERMGLN